MSKYIIDMLGDIDEKLLEEALDLPEQAEEIVLEPDGRHGRGSVFAAAAAIAASLAIVAGVVLFRANFGRIATLPNEGSSTDISDDFSGGIFIPNEFTEEDKELQFILNSMNNDALELCKLFGYYSGSSYEGRNEKYFLFPQMAQPLTYQFDKYRYFSDNIMTNSNLLKQLSASFSKKAVAEFTKSMGKGIIKDGGIDDIDWTIYITEGGSFNDDGVLVEPPNVIELNNGGVYRLGKYSRRNFGGYWSTAKVISRTEDEIIFSYVYESYGELYETKGILVNEKGWKFSWCGEWLF